MDWKDRSLWQEILKKQPRQQIFDNQILRELNEDTLSDTYCISSSESTFSDTSIPTIPNNSFESSPNPVTKHSLSNNNLPTDESFPLTNTNKQNGDNNTESIKLIPSTTSFSSPEKDNPNNTLNANTLAAIYIFL